MMTVKEYAQDTGHSIAEILKKCNELGIKVKSGDDDLSEDFCRIQPDCSADSDDEEYYCG